MAKSSTSTSIYHNYEDLGRREIYGINFPDGLRANERFPMGPILTPTTKADGGHDLELDEDGAAEIADKVGGKGTWNKVKIMTRSLFDYGSFILGQKGLLLADTKYEIGIDKDGNLIVIDEVHTSDSSRFWEADTYPERFASGENPDAYDKEILRRWLSEHGFRGEGFVPSIPAEVTGQMSTAYQVPYVRITEESLSEQTTNAQEVQKAIVQYFLNS